MSRPAERRAATLENAGTQRSDRDELLHELIDEVRGLRARVERLEARQPRRGDRDRDGRLVAAIAASFGASIFGTADLLNAPSPELKAMLLGLDGRIVGAWLKRAREKPIAGYIVRRVGRDDAGALWQLHVSTMSHTACRPSRNRGAD